jgi:hypothetical protein
MYSILCLAIPRQNYKKKMELLAISTENVTFAVNKTGLSNETD